MFSPAQALYLVSTPITTNFNRYHKTLYRYTAQHVYQYTAPLKSKQRPNPVGLYLVPSHSILSREARCSALKALSGVLVAPDRGCARGSARRTYTNRVAPSHASTLGEHVACLLPRARARHRSECRRPTNRKLAHRNTICLVAGT